MQTTTYTFEVVVPLEGYFQDTDSAADAASACACDYNAAREEAEAELEAAEVDKEQCTFIRADFVEFDGAVKPHNGGIFEVTYKVPVELVPKLNGHFFPDGGEA